MYIHTLYVDILFPVTKAIPIMFERVTTNYQALKRWIGHNATRYHNLNALPYALPCIFSQFILDRPNGTNYHNFNTLPHALPYIFSKFRMVWGLFATGDHVLPSNL